ncbi:hypothetical protein AWW66_19185 [Micromonospora rosaria]|uniref:Uncharacterized protein n=1 Tax=Micromonospora rosaria TaxID=47874 RepID=A0A136PPL2_9ACTN|nr:hypothetical protein AWW66_19185 [Micromonospora rosaria]
MRRIGVRLCDGKPLNILFNAAAALVAGARPHELHLVRLLFVDVPGEEIYRRAGLRVATAAEVDQPIHDRYLRLLAAEERRDVTYHRPERLGDLLFNWFD